MIKAKQKKIHIYSNNADVKLIGILDYINCEVYYEEHERYDAKVFLEFLKITLSHYKSGKSIMILDNAKIYNAKLFKAFSKKLKIG